MACHAPSAWVLGCGCGPCTNTTHYYLAERSPRPTRKPRASVDLSQDMAVELLGIVERHVMRTQERDAEGVRDYLREQIQAALAEDRR